MIAEYFSPNYMRHQELLVHFEIALRRAHSPGMQAEYGELCSMMIWKAMQCYVDCRRRQYA
jgi:hypothetical protein